MVVVLTTAVVKGVTPRHEHTDDRLDAAYVVHPRTGWAARGFKVMTRSSMVDVVVYVEPRVTSDVTTVV